MYDTQIDNAIAAVFLEMNQNRVTSSNAFITTDAVRGFLRWAMQKLVQDLSAGLANAGQRGSMGLLMASNFLERAAWDLYGPCTCGALLESRGEWGAVSMLRHARSHGLQRTLFGLGRSVGAYLLAPAFEISVADNAADRVDKLIRQTWQAHVTFGVELCTRLARDAAAIRQLFGVTGNPTAFYVAGSDPHSCAQRVVIVSYGLGRVVYKPTDLIFQALLMGTPQSLTAARAHNPSVVLRASLFDTINANLPLLHILSTRSYAHGIRGRGGHGYMEFKAKAQVFATAQAQADYFRAMGKLVAVAALLGITDLHHENIMATANGPYIIDGEMCLCAPREGVTAISLDHTAILAALVPRPPGSNIGGTFVPYLDEDGTWEATRISEMDGSNDSVLAGIKATALGPWLAARDQVDNIVDGANAAIDAMASRHDHIQNWLIAYRRIRHPPLARVILSTTDMITNHMIGLSDRLNGNLAATLRSNASFHDWLSWYAGHKHAVPGAWVMHGSPEVVSDSHGVIGVPVGEARRANAKITTLFDLRIRLARCLMGNAVASTKQTLQSQLEQGLGNTAMRARQVHALAARGIT